MAYAFTLILASLLAGYGCARAGLPARAAADWCNRFVIYVCLPAVVLRLIPKLEWDARLAVLVLTPWLVAVVSVLLVLAFARIARLDRAALGALLLCVPLGNTSFLGYPVVGALFGAQGVAHAVLYDQFGSFLILSTYGMYVVARFGGGSEPKLWAIAMRILKFPPFIALLIAFVPVRHPPLLDEILRLVGQWLAPVALFSVGLTLELRRPREPLALAFGLSTKLVLAPLCAFALARLLGAPPLALRVAVLEAGMPPMVTAGVLAVMARLAPELATALVALGIVCSALTLPVAAALLSALPL